MTDDTKDKIDFSFKDAEQGVDKLFKEKKEEAKGKAPTIPHISDKIRQGLEIKHNLPDKGFLEVKFDEVNVTTTDKEGNERTEKKVRVTHKDIDGKETVEFTRGIYELDLRDDATFWFTRTPEVIPQRIKQCVRAAIDRKKCYEFGKRKVEIPYLLIAVLVVGAVIIGISFLSMMMR